MTETTTTEPQVTFFNARLAGTPALTKVTAEWTVESSQVIFQVGIAMAATDRKGAAQVLADLESIERRQRLDRVHLDAEREGIGAVWIVTGPSGAAMVRVRDGRGKERTGYTTRDALVDALKRAIAHLDATAHLVPRG